MDRGAKLGGGVRPDPNIGAGVAVAVALIACGARSGLDVPTSSSTSSGSTSTGAGGSVAVSPCKPGDPPVALASGLSWPYGIAIDDAYVYFTTYDKAAGAVWRVPKLGGPALTVAPSLDHPDQIVLVGDFVYAAVAGEARIIRVPKAGGPVTTFASGQSGASGMSTDGTLLYWTNYLGNQIVMSDLQGKLTTFPAASQGPFRIAAGPDRIFYTALGAGLYFAMKDGSALGELLSPSPRTPVFGNDNRVYWTDHGLYRSYKDGTAKEAFGELPGMMGKFYDGLALDADHAFVTVAEGDILRFSLHSDPPDTLFSGQDTPSGIAVDDACLYWTNTSPGTANGTVMRGPKGG